MNESQYLKKILTTLNRRRYLIYLLLSFLAGSLLTGFLLYRPRPGAVTIISEIRKKLKVLADFYNSGDPGDGGN